MDRMQMYEVSALMQYSFHKHKDEWEQARLIAYLVAQTNSTKKLKMEDIIKFSWEKETIEKDESSVTKEDLEAMMREADEMKKIMFGEQQ